MITENNFSGAADGLGAGGFIGSMRFRGDNKKLPAFQPPQPRQCQIKTQQEERIFRSVHQRVRQKARRHLLQDETFHFKNLAQRCLRQNRVMIKKIPIQAREIFDVWPHRNQPSAWFQTAKRLAQRPLETFLVRQMFEKIAGEHRVQRVLRQRPSDGTVLFKKADGRREVLRSNRIQIHGIFLPGHDVVDKLTVTAAEVQHGGCGRNPAIKKRSGQHLPDAVAVSGRLAEPLPVNSLQFLGILGHGLMVFVYEVEISSQFGFCSAWLEISSSTCGKEIFGCQFQCCAASDESKTIHGMSNGRGLESLATACWPKRASHQSVNCASDIAFAAPPLKLAIRGWSLPRCFICASNTGTRSRGCRQSSRRSEEP